MRDNHSLPVFINMGTVVEGDTKVIRNYYCKFSNLTKTLVKRRYFGLGKDNENVRRTSLVSRTPTRPLSAGYHTLAERRTEALERQLQCASLSAAERIAHLDRMFGNGRGASRERNRLNRSLQENSTTTAKMSKKKASRQDSASQNT